MSAPLCTVVVGTEEDVVTARSRARRIAELLGFDRNDQTRIATSVSEIIRNAFHYAGGGKVEYALDQDAGLYLITVSDEGGGIADEKNILAGEYVSATGIGLGILGARRLMDDFSIRSEPGRGTAVRLGKRLPAKSARVTPQRLAKIAGELTKSASGDLLEELRQENRDLLRLMEELRARQQELSRLNAELEDTNRGVVALYAELDEKAERLRRADQMKSRFLSHMSHEFRTPLTSIMALSRLLGDEADGPLGGEQKKQVSFIRKSAETLLEMVNDLLDLARVEAGKTVVRPAQFHVASLFGGLRGVLRPLQVKPEVELIFEEPAGIPELYTDESKVSQILRNFVSNALKFTERGEVRVSARLNADGHTVVFSVTDTGIGIAPPHLDVIFREFAQIDTPIQKNVRGSGLGLALSKGLAELLGGRVGVESELGRGSQFFAEIPLVYAGGGAEDAVSPACDLLLIDDEEVSRYLIRQCLGPSLKYAEASGAAEGLALAKRQHPRAIILDLKMPDVSGFEVLKDLKLDPETRRIPVVIMTSKSLTAGETASLGQNAVAVFSKDVLSSADAGERIRGALGGVVNGAAS